MRKAFTLIEILVVVAIIALLISILLPSLSAAKERSKTVICESNLKQVYNGLIFYLYANNDRMPISGRSFESIMKYIQKGGIRETQGNTYIYWVDVYLCSGDPIPHTTADFQVQTPSGPMTAFLKTSYGINTSLCYALYPSANNPGITRRMSSVKRPSDIVSFFDSGDDDRNGAQTWELNEHNNVDNQREFEIHHKKGSNFAFADGHVSFYKAFLNNPPQYGLPPFPANWIVNWDGIQYANFVRNPPIP